jgi:hypothetical protein
LKVVEEDTQINYIIFIIKSKGPRSCGLRGASDYKVILISLSSAVGKCEAQNATELSMV